VRDLVEIALFTDDLEAARGFYADLAGAPVAEWPGGATFAIGNAKILVHERAAAVEDGPPNEDHFALSVDGLDDACSALVATGHVFLVEPRDYP
jgi:catechol 2,3-dioxygenase-like lactoylglutathione lyase family enzyme